MALLTVAGRNDLKWCLNDAEGNPVMGILMIGEGVSGAFPCFFLSDRTITYYYWPTATTGALRYGATEPTVATRASAGSAQ